MQSFAHGQDGTDPHLHLYVSEFELKLFRGNAFNIISRGMDSVGIAFLLRKHLKVIMFFFL